MPATTHPQRPAAPGLSNLLLAATGCALIIAWLCLTQDRMLHWFLAPVFLCGVLIGLDAVEYLRGRLDMFDPVGILGLFGVHFFFLAPLLHVAWDVYLEHYLEHPRDWREWLGWMAMLNAAGLCLYQIARRRAALWGGDAPPRTEHRIVHGRMIFALLAGLAISGALQVGFYIQRGGLLSYIETVTASVGAAPDEQADQGMGIVFMVSESFPILLVMFYAMLAERKKYARTMLAVMAVLAVFFVLKLFFGGLRGSRSNIIWSLFWASGVLHYRVHPLSRKFIATGLCFLVAFMYLYGFYKGLGRDVIDVYKAGALAEKSQRRMDSMLLGDLGRADVHAFLLHRIMRPESDYKIAWGRTYIGAAGLLIPRSLYPHRRPIKTMEGTDCFYGAGTYAAGKWYSSKVYGLAGETMLNFGPWPVPLAYLLYGLLVGRLQRFLQRLQPDDARLFIYPFLVLWAFSFIQSDSDNLIFNFIKDGMMPLAVVWFGSRSVRRASRPTGCSLPPAQDSEQPAGLLALRS